MQEARRQSPPRPPRTKGRPTLPAGFRRAIALRATPGQCNACLRQCRCRCPRCASPPHRKSGLIVGFFGGFRPAVHQARRSMRRHRMVRIQLQRLFPQGRCAPVVPRNFQDARELLVQPDFVGPEVDGPLQLPDRLLVAAKPVIRGPEVAQDIDPARTLVLEDLEMLQRKPVLPGGIQLFARPSAARDRPDSPRRTARCPKYRPYYLRLLRMPGCAFLPDAASRRRLPGVQPLRPVGKDIIRKPRCKRRREKREAHARPRAPPSPATRRLWQAPDRCKAACRAQSTTQKNTQPTESIRFVAVMVTAMSFPARRRAT